MTFLKFILYFIVFIFAFRLFWRIFGPSILQFLVKRLVRKMENDFVKRQNKFQSATDPNIGEEVHLSKDAKITTPKADVAPRTPKQNIIDVEYEEIQ